MPFFDEEGLDFISSCRTQMELCNAHPNQRLSGDQQMEMLVDLCGVRPRWWAKVCRIKTICSLFLFVFRLRLFSPSAREKLWSPPPLVSSPLFAPLKHPSVFILKTDGSSERHLKLSFPFFSSSPSLIRRPHAFHVSALISTHRCAASNAHTQMHASLT